VAQFRCSRISDSVTSLLITSNHPKYINLHELISFYLSLIGKMSTQLPPPKDDQVFYHLTALEAGTLGAREHFSVEGGDSAKVTIIPTLSFLIQNASLGRKMLFDLGIRKKMNELSPGTLAILPLFAPCKADPDIIDSLKNLRESIGPKDIDHIFISHVHWYICFDFKHLIKSNSSLGITLEITVHL